MAKYVDGYVVPVPKRKLAEYRALARKAGKIWREHGALEYVECIADDVAAPVPGRSAPLPAGPVYRSVVVGFRTERGRLT